VLRTDAAPFRVLVDGPAVGGRVPPRPNNASPPPRGSESEPSGSRP